MPIREGDVLVLRFGTRYRIQTLVSAAIFVFFAGLGGWCHFWNEPLGLWLGLAYVMLIVPMTIVALYCAFHAMWHQIDLSSAGLIVHHLFRNDEQVSWSSVSAIRWQKPNAVIVIETILGERIRVSTELDGLYALARFASEAPLESRDTTFFDWMIEKM